MSKKIYKTDKTQSVEITDYVNRMDEKISKTHTPRPTQLGKILITFRIYDKFSERLPINKNS